MTPTIDSAALAEILRRRVASNRRFTRAACEEVAVCGLAALVAVCGLAALVALCWGLTALAFCL